MFREIMLTIACVSALTTNAAADPKGMPRSGPWVANYDRDACHLAAKFGAGDDEITLRFARYEPSDQFALTVYGKRLPVEGVWSEAEIDFGLAAKPIKAFSLNGGAGDKKATIFSGQRIDGWKPKLWNDPAPSITTEQEAKVTGVDIAFKVKRPTYRLRLEFGSLVRPLAQLRDCTTNLVKRWGYDPAVQATLSRKATPTAPPQSWVTNKDFPEGASRAGHIGTVQFRFDIGADARILGCYVLDRTDPDSFGDLSCRLLSSRARFHPALDAAGKPVRSYFVHKIAWM